KDSRARSHRNAGFRFAKKPQPNKVRERKPVSGTCDVFRAVAFQPKQFCGPIRRMKTRARFVVYLSFVEPLPKTLGLRSASRICPSENFCCRSAGFRDADQAVPERRRRNIADIFAQLF